jgi:pilus assembly protein CpaC
MHRPGQAEPGEEGRAGNVEKRLERDDGGTPVKIPAAGASRIPRSLAHAALVLIATVSALSVPSRFAAAQSAQAWQSQGDRARHIVVTLNKSRVFSVGQPFSSVIVGQPEYADVLPMTDNSIYIQGKKVGTTNVSVFAPDKQRLLGVLDLEVVPDTGNVGAKIQASTGSGNIRVSSSNGQVVLSGEAADAVSAERAVAVAKGLSPDAPVVNAMKVSPSQQVMLKVRFLEASREAGNALGVNWFVFNNKGTRGIVTGIGNTAQAPRPTLNGTNAAGTAATAGAGVSALAAAGTLAGTTAAPFGTALASLVNKGASIDALITALESKGAVRRLAEPDLIALSGDSASFLAGGQFPVPVVQQSSGTVPTITVDYKSFGVQLTFMPTVLANGLINLRLAPSVSEIDPTNSVVISGFSIPALTTREARTTVELRDGQSFAIAGLLQSDIVENIDQLPWIGSVPVLGTLFRSTSYQKNETDLVVIVTPHLVKPAAPGDHLATPFDQRLQGNDVDIFAMGQLERKKKYTDYVSSGGDLAGPYGHIIQPEPEDANAYVTKK